MAMLVGPLGERMSLVTRLTETHVSTYITLSREPSDFSLRRRGGEPGGA